MVTILRVEQRTSLFCSCKTIKDSSVLNRVIGSAWYAIKVEQIQTNFYRTLVKIWKFKKC